MRFWGLYLTILAVLILWLSSRGSLPLTELIYQNPPSPPTSLRKLEFKEVALQKGLAFEHRQNTGYLSSFIDTLGGDACVINVNDDDWPDLFLVGGSGTRRHFGKTAWWATSATNRLYVNVEGRFVDQSGDYGLRESTSNIASIGCTVADVDGDQSDDLIVFGEGGAYILYQRSGKFVEAALLQNESAITDAVVFDADRDGDQDIYLTNLVSFEPGMNILERFSGFTASDPAFEPVHYDAQANFLFINRGEKGFADQASDWGVANQQGRSLGAKVFDFNQDGVDDLLTVNGFGTPNQIYLGQEVGFSSAVSYESLKFSSQSAVSSGRDWFFGRSDEFPLAGIQWHGENYDDQSRKLALGQTSLIASSTWGLVEVDLDLDGRLDLVLANGLLQPDSDSIRSASGQPNYMLLNKGDSYEPNRIDEHDQYRSSRAVVALDFDRDGDQDLLVANNNDRFLLYENLVVDSDTPIIDRDPQEEIALAKLLPVLRGADGIANFWASSSDQFKLTILRHSANERDMTSGMVIQLGLRSSDFEVRAAAIDLAKSMEMDWSVDWLIPLLNDEDVSLSCRVSDLFAHFFEEEEIAIRRKALALKALMRVAETSLPSAGCALNALGYAENKRVLPTLYKVASSSSDQRLKAMAVRAIGQIRDTGGLRFLTELQKQQIAPKVLAATTIALVRLNQQGVLKESLQGRSTVDQLEVLFNLYNSDDRSVIGQSVLLQEVRRLVPLTSSPAEQTMLANVIAASRDRSFLKQLASLPDAEIHALVNAEVALTQKLPAAYEQLALSQLDQILAQTQNIKITARQFSDLRKLGVDENRLMELLTFASNGVLAEIMSAELNRAEEVALQACANSFGAPIKVSGQYAKFLTSYPVTSAKCFFYGASEIITQRRKVAARVQVRQLESDLDAQERRRLRLHLSRFDKFYLPKSSNVSDEMRSLFLEVGGEISDQEMKRWVQEAASRGDKLTILSELARRDRVKAMELFENTY